VGLSGLPPARLRAVTWPFLFIAALYTLTPVTLTVHPRVGMAPSTFRVTVIVPRHFDNRRICFGYSGNEDRKSCLDLEGWTSRRTWTVYYDIRTAGEYVAEAILTRVTDGREETFQQSQPFRVVGFEVEP
jgi:hypothetical protein